MTGKTIRFQTEVVSGICPTCDEHTMLVGPSFTTYFWYYPGNVQMYYLRF